MDFFELAQRFIDQCKLTSDLGALTNSFEGAVQGLGFKYFFCCSHFAPLNPSQRTVLLFNYPSGWVRNYIDRGMYLADPVLRHAERSLLPFFWDAPQFQQGLSRSQRRSMACAARFGIAHGYTVPLHAPSPVGVAPASCTVIPDPQAAIDPRHYHLIQLMAHYLFECASRVHRSDEPQAAPPALTTRERQCLEFAARGKTDREIGLLLNLSEHTVHNHIESAKRRLGVITRVQAIVLAIMSRQISFDEERLATSISRGERRRRSMT